MKKKIDSKLTNNQDMEGRWKRALADYQNLEKRIEREKESFVKFANATLLVKLLGVLDSLEQAEEHLKDNGLTLAVDQFRKVLGDEGIEEIKIGSGRFAADEMECVEQTEGPENQVVKVVLKGYKLNGKVLRPIKVKVGGKGKTK